MSERGVDYFYAQLVKIWTSCSGMQFRPQDLNEALPNRTYPIPGKTTFSYSEVALISLVMPAERPPRDVALRMVASAPRTGTSSQQA